jgi:hypothetical protein
MLNQDTTGEKQQRINTKWKFYQVQITPEQHYKDLNKSTRHKKGKAVFMFDNCTYYLRQNKLTFQSKDTGGINFTVGQFCKAIFSSFSQQKSSL